MLLPKDSIANSVDDNTPYSTGNDITQYYNWFWTSRLINKYLKANPNKYYVLLSDKYDTQCYALRNLVPIVQFKKCEKGPWRNDTFSKVAGLYQIAKRITVIVKNVTIFDSMTNF